MKVNKNHFLKTTAASDLKVGRCTELNDVMTLQEYLCESHSVFKLKFCFSKTFIELFETKYHVKALRSSGTKHL